MRRLYFDLVDIGVVAAVGRRAFLHQRIEGEFDVFSGDRCTVMKARLPAQHKAHPGIVGGFLDRFRDQTIGAERLVQALHSEGGVDQADVVGGDPLADKGVEAIEATETGFTKGTAFGGVGVGVFEVGEVGGVLGRLVIQGDGMLGGGEGEAGQTEQDEAATVEQETAQRVGHRAFSVGFSHQVRRPRV